MDSKASRIPYRQTNAFSRLALEYIDQSPGLKPFYSNPPTLKGIRQAIEARKKFDTHRELLVNVLRDQYAEIKIHEKTRKNIESLLSSSTFTVTTAHQNNIFTGPLYFIYKIVHAIRLASHLNEMFPGEHFVPVYYMGSEDADLAELNHIHLAGEKLEWPTSQKGAVGRMKTDDELLKLVDKMEGQLSVLPFGKEFIDLLRDFYQPGTSIQDATFHLVNHLFGEYGLLVLLPDNPQLKKQMLQVFQDDLLHQTASQVVDQTAKELDAAGYKVQVNPREINLFYLKDHLRERIERVNYVPGKDSLEAGKWKVINTDLHFTEKKLFEELENNPQRFSPNVILRGLYQETILPDIAFIGGGGEIAYWLQLKKLFEHYRVPFPVLVLRNSFLIVEKRWQESIRHLGFEPEDFFLPGQELLNRWVERESKTGTRLNGSLSELEKLYDLFRQQASAIDVTLEKHVDALKLKTVHRLQELEKKMLRAEKRKFTDQQRQIQKIRSVLFPKDGLQERYDNLAYYYSLWGKDFIRMIYDHSPALEQEFTIITIAG